MQPALSAVTLPDAAWLAGGALAVVDPASPAAAEAVVPIRVAAAVLAQRGAVRGSGRAAVAGASRSR